MKTKDFHGSHELDPAIPCFTKHLDEVFLHLPTIVQMRVVKQILEKAYPFLKNPYKVIGIAIYHMWEQASQIANALPTLYQT